MVSGYEAKVRLVGQGAGWPWCPRGQPCPCVLSLQVYSASNVELVTKTRTEHLSDQDKSRSKGDSPSDQGGGGCQQWGGTVLGQRGARCWVHCACLHYPLHLGVSLQAPGLPFTPSWAWRSSTAPTTG